MNKLLKLMVVAVMINSASAMAVSMPSMPSLDSVKKKIELTKNAVVTSRFTQGVKLAMWDAVPFDASEVKRADNGVEVSMGNELVKALLKESFNKCTQITRVASIPALTIFGAYKLYTTKVSRSKTVVDAEKTEQEDNQAA